MNAHMYVWAIRNDNKQVKRQNKNRLILKHVLSYINGWTGEVEDDDDDDKVKEKFI